ncbi:tetratricopeptide repeat protein [Streptomyces bathyalis]|uniref:Tetratricopeptide repeat protein n=1 Tax=Streptomyces bathyalis TaxID=2710756 RepID=A0A7T1T589_9ACTN|nr:SAV_2336 N-terminal domain-related protein [Streptomyces bathyalis]QPP06629.1 tetratricopeptide repeat protein [Streptomyces bathyalis]
MDRSGLPSGLPHRAGSRLAALVSRMREAGWEPTAEEVADALWLARWADPGAREVTQPAPVQDGEEAAEAAGDLYGHRRQMPAPETDEPESRSPAPGRRAATPSRSTVSLYAPDRHGGAPGSAFPVRAPAASTLPGLLGMQRALRPLLGYRPRLPSLPSAHSVLDEAASAELSARSGAVRPVFGPAARPEAELLLLMDASATTSVWQLTFDKLRQTCERLGAFRDVQALCLHRGKGGTPLIGTGPDPSTTRLRPADQYRDTTGRRLTLIVSDCVGPLWQDGGAQRLLHRWSGGSPTAVVQPLPPRLWPRTALPGEPGLLVRDTGQGGPVTFEPDGYGPPPAPDALPVPVLLPTPAALGSWARLLGGEGRQTVRGAAAWVRPRHHAMPAPQGSRRADPRELLGAFRASASPGALDLAVHLAAVPLVLPVIQLVQEAMLPDTGPMELAEVLLSGLLERLPDVEDSPGPRYDFVYGVQELLLQSLDQGAAELVLKHLSEYVTRRFGKGTRNFPALAVARLSRRSVGEEPAEDARSDIRDVPDELFAQIPARVVRQYIPDPAADASGGAAQAELLLRRWREQGDPWLLDEARRHAEAGVAAEEENARLVLGQVLRAMTRTGAVRRRPGRAQELLREAESLLTGDGIEIRLELARVQYELWKNDGDLAPLLAAVRTLRGAAGGTRRADGTLRKRVEAERRLWLGRVLLELCRTEDGGHAEQRSVAAEAAVELGAAADLLITTGRPDDRLCGALLDRSSALRRSGAEISERLANLDRAEVAAGEDGALRLRCARGRARVHRDGGDLSAADSAFAAAEALTERDSLDRAELLTEWGSMLLDDGGAEEASGHAEGLLREALTTAPAEGALASRVQLLLGGALVARYQREQFLPDLYEGCHLLELAARKSPEGQLRAEAWLSLGKARQLYPAGHVQPGRAREALTRSLNEALEARGAARASVAVARALMGRADLHRRADRSQAALADYRAASDEWQRLAGELSEELPWDEIRETRERIAALEAG